MPHAAPPALTRSSRNAWFPIGSVQIGKACRTWTASSKSMQHPPSHDDDRRCVALLPLLGWPTTHVGVAAPHGTVSRQRPSQSPLAQPTHSCVPASCSRCGLPPGAASNGAKTATPLRVAGGRIPSDIPARGGAPLAAAAIRKRRSSIISLTQPTIPLATHSEVCDVTSLCVRGGGLPLPGLVSSDTCAVSLPTVGLFFFL